MAGLIRSTFPAGLLILLGMVLAACGEPTPQDRPATITAPAATRAGTAGATMVMTPATAGPGGTTTGAGLLPATSTPAGAGSGPNATATITGLNPATTTPEQPALTATSGATAALVPATTGQAVATTGAPATAARVSSPAPATATPNTASLPPRYIDALRARSYDGGEIKLDRLYEQTAAYTAHLIYYQSDGLRISGLMMVPNGPKDRKYPVALINHGYFDPPEYDSGWDTLRELRFFARNGYITIASDYRNYARSDKGDNDRAPGYAIDVLNLIEAAQRLPQADPSKLTLMGHSMGGEIVLHALVVNKNIKVAALFGTMSADAADNFYARLKWRGGDTPEKRIYGDPAQQPEVYRRMSPLTYFPDITAPVIIHVGANDTTTPPVWSEKIYNELKARGKTTEYYSYSGQGHSLNGAAFDSAMQRTLAFFNRALGR